MERNEVTVPHNKKGRPKNNGEFSAEGEMVVPEDYHLS
jgi:hypothetical protein